MAARETRAFRLLRQPADPAAVALHAAEQRERLLAELRRDLAERNERERRAAQEELDAFFDQEAIDARTRQEMDEARARHQGAELGAGGSVATFLCDEPCECAEGRVEDDCVICMESVGQPHVRMFTCAHLLHSQCG